MLTLADLKVGMLVWFDNLDDRPGKGYRVPGIITSVGKRLVITIFDCTYSSISRDMSHDGWLVCLEPCTREEIQAYCQKQQRQIDKQVNQKLHEYNQAKAEAEAQKAEFEAFMKKLDELAGVEV